jgi:hypothetical protein
MPQLSGDRPPQGFEHLLCVHPKGKKHWNGPGILTHFSHLATRGEEKHKCEKPLDQALDLVSFFSDVGEHVFDPFAGSGAIGLACLLLGRRYTGFDDDPIWVPRANVRLTGAISARDCDRIQRWLDADSEPVSAQKDGLGVARARSRALDKDNVRKGVYL